MLGQGLSSVYSYLRAAGEKDKENGRRGRREIGHPGNKGNCAQSSFNKEQTYTHKHCWTNTLALTHFSLTDMLTCTDINSSSPFLFILTVPLSLSEKTLGGFLPLMQIYSRFPHASSRPAVFEVSEDSTLENLNNLFSHM